MDQDSIKPASPADETAEDPASRSGAGAEPTGGFLSRLFGRSNADDVVDTSVDATDRLGPAFRNSAPAELAMVNNILRLHELRVEDVMTPRADVVAVAEDSALADVIEASERGSHSRLPVYRETLDDPIGFVHLKDLALHYGFDRQLDASNFRVVDHMRTALFVPPSMRIAALLQKMQGERIHMALVIDEFGGVDGLVTIEDLVEQIVGDIEDEHDREDIDEWHRESDNAWLVQARADISEFEEAEGVSLRPEDDDEDVDTMGGLVFMLANRVPTRGEVIVHPLGFEFEIVDADARRIKRLRLRLGNRTGALSQAAE